MVTIVFVVMSASSKSNGIEVNGDCEIPQELTISEDMPKWKQEQRKRYNEKIRVSESVALYAEFQNIC